MELTRISLPVLLFSIAGAISIPARAQSQQLSFDEFKHQLTSLIRKEMAIARHVSPEQVDILRFQVGAYATASLFVDRFFNEAYPIYKQPTPDRGSFQIFFQDLKSRIQASTYPTALYYISFFAARMKEQYLTEPLYQAEFLRFVAFGEDYFNDTVGPDQLARDYVTLLVKGTVDRAWVSLWATADSSLLSAYLDMTRSYELGVSRTDRYHAQANVLSLMAVSDPESERRLEIIREGLMTYVRHASGHDPWQVSFDLDWLHRLRHDNPEFRERVFNFFLGDHFEVVETSARILAESPGLDSAKIQAIIERVLSRRLAARTFFYFIEEVIYRLLKHSSQAREMAFRFFFQEHPEILGEHGSVRYYLPAAFGCASPSPEMLKFFLDARDKTDDPIYRRGLAMALGAGKAQPQLPDYRLALEEALTSPLDWPRECARAVISMPRPN